MLGLFVRKELLAWLLSCLRVRVARMWQSGGTAFALAEATLRDEVWKQRERQKHKFMTKIVGYEV